VRLFENHPGVLADYQRRWHYILVDEYQDTNPVQYRLLRLLSAEHRNLCVVGDEDQSIYGFREADIRNILDFEKDFSGAQVIRLERNYRSRQQRGTKGEDALHRAHGRGAHPLLRGRGRAR
jgi:DNA helicase-2/ATP-dependent DNA helicase PcrA